MRPAPWQVTRKGPGEPSRGRSVWKRTRSPSICSMTAMAVRVCSVGSAMATREVPRASAMYMINWSCMCSSTAAPAANAPTTCSAARVPSSSGLSCDPRSNSAVPPSPPPAAVTACTSSPAVYSVDLHPVLRVGPGHHPIQKSPDHLTAEDLDTQAVDLIFLDCHHYSVTISLLRYVLKKGLLAPEGLIALHDTGLHPAPPDCLAPPHYCNRTRKHAALVSLQDERLPKDEQWKRGWMHQPVGRLIVQWLTKFDCNAEWQTLVAHDDQ